VLKIDRIRVHLRAGATASNDHQAVDLARAIAESLAARTVDHGAVIDKLSLSVHTTGKAHTKTLADCISSRISSHLRKSSNDA